MKTLAIGSLFVLFAIVASINAIPVTFADHPTVEVQFGIGTGIPGCEETDECYVPYEVTVDVGGEVTWINDDSAIHTVTAGIPLTDEAGTDYPNGFDSGFVSSGETYTQVFEIAGTYPYFCQLHPWMIGVVNVEGDGQHAGPREGDTETMMMMAESLDDVMAKVTNVGDGEQGSPLSMNIEIAHADGSALEHVNFKIIATQDGEEVLNEDAVHTHDGTYTTQTAALKMDAADTPVDVKIELLGFGVDEITGPSGELATVQIVPEFGTIAMMILAVSIVSIIAITAKSRVIPRI